MQIRSSSIVNTTTTHIIELSPAEAADAVNTFGTLAGAVIAGAFPGLLAQGFDVIAIDQRLDTTVIVVITERTAIPDVTQVGT